MAKSAALGTTMRRPEPDDRQLAPGHQLVGEGPGDPEEPPRLGHGEDQSVSGVQGRRLARGRPWVRPLVVVSDLE